MPIPSGSPYGVTDALCRHCLKRMRMRPAIEHGVGRILYSCDACKCTFEASAMFINGTWASTYDAPVERAVAKPAAAKV